MYAPKGINIKVVQAFLQINSFLKECASFVNELLKKEKLLHPEIISFDFDEAYKAHETQENPKIIQKSNIKI